MISPFRLSPTARPRIDFSSGIEIKGKFKKNADKIIRIFGCDRMTPALDGSAAMPSMPGLEAFQLGADRWRMRTGGRRPRRGRARIS